VGAHETLLASRSLTVTQRAVVQLAYFERLSPEEIAVRLGMSVRTVKAAAATALQRVAEAVEPGPPNT